MKMLAMAPAVALAACLLAAAASTAEAAKRPTPTAARTPTGYRIVESSGFTAQNGVQSRAAVFCPAGTVVWGGGAEIFGPDPNLNLNSSAPLIDGSGWTASVNNVSGSDGTYVVQAVCAKAPRRYRIVESPAFTDGEGTQVTGSQACPARTRLLGGGSVSNSDSLAVNINSEFPFFNGWEAAQNDNTNFDTTFNVFAICGKAPATYTIASGPIVSAPRRSASRPRASSARSATRSAAASSPTRARSRSI
jgi:hypothetical protein